MAGPPTVFLRLPALPAEMEWWMPLSAPLTNSFSIAPSGFPEPSPHECVVPSAPSSWAMFILKRMSLSEAEPPGKIL